MLKGREKNQKTEEISGLALALLLDQYFVDFFDLCESNNKPVRRFRPRQSLPGSNQVRRIASKGVFLRRI